MPKRLEEAFKRSARKQGIEPGSERWGAYVYGGMRKVEERQERDGHDHDDGKAGESSDR